YVDDIFFTSNDSLECIDQMLDEANNFHPNIKLVRQIGRSVPFLDVLIENRKGTLTTSVYHKEAADPYVVPFGSDHSGHVFRNTVDTAITRALLTTSTATTYDKVTRTSATNQTHGKNMQNHNLKPTDNNDFTTRKRRHHSPKT
ncbi:unnamed protein product, partial [Rotaria socialis]